MNRFVIYIILFSASLFTMQAQELNVKLSINTQQISTTNKDVFTSMQTAINQLLNDQKWTDATFSQNEKIDCIIAITITEMVNESSFKGEIQVTSRRPVYGSSYITPILNYRDTQFEFNYMQGESLYFNNSNTTGNLTATIAFYAYVIIGMDFDSFSLNGGRPFFNKAMNIANSAQSLNTKGWEAFSGKANRYDLAIALTEESSKDFHTMWYNYNRLGLDEMVSNPARGRIRIIESIDEIQKLYEARPNSPLLTVFAEAKMDELIKVCSEASNEEKQEIKKKLLQLFPTKRGMINNL